MSTAPMRHVVKVLLVDDDEDDFLITRDTLSETKVLEFDIEWLNFYDAELLERRIRYAVENHRTMQVLLDREHELLESQKMEAVGRMAGGVAHELNNLMTVLLANAEFVKEEVAENQEATEFVNEIRDAGRRACRLTQQQLTFGNRQKGQSELLDIEEILRDMDSMLRRVIGEGIQFESGLGSGGSRISVDREHLELLVMNLIVNAFDAMPGGGRPASRDSGYRV